MRMRWLGLALSGLVVSSLTTLVGCGSDCGDGTYDNGDGRCVPTAVSCGEGTVVANSQCVPSVSGCGQGTRLEGNVCIPDAAAATCGTGTTYDTATGVCIGNAGITCGAGTTLVNNVCTAPTGGGGATCGAGTVLQGDECVPDGSGCGDGTALVDGVCRPGAYIQVVHNIPDSAAASVDVYVNGELFADNVAYQTASAFTGVLSDGTLDIAITDGAAADASSPLLSGTVTVALGEQVALIASGDGAGNFQLFRVAARRVGNPDEFDVAFVNGSADVGDVRFFQGFYDLLSSGSNADGIALGYGDSTDTPLQLAGVSFAFDALVGNARTLLGTFQTTGTGLPAVTTRSTTQGHALVVIVSGLGGDVGLYGIRPSGGAFIALDHGAHAQFVNLDTGAARRDFYINNALQVGRLPLNAATYYFPLVSGAQNTFSIYVEGSPRPAGVNPPQGASPVQTGTQTFNPDGNYFIAIQPNAFVSATFEGRRSTVGPGIDVAAFNAQSVTVDIDAFVSSTTPVAADLASNTSTPSYTNIAAGNTFFTVSNGDGTGDAAFNNNLSTVNPRSAVVVPTGTRNGLDERLLIVLSDGEVRTVSPELIP